MHSYTSICYTLVFNYLINLSDNHTEQLLDKNTYNDAALVEIAIPLNMPYMSNQANYERYDGSIEINGMHYNYVKRKINNDTLHILCIPNEEKTQLHEAKSNFSKQLADASTGKKENDSQAKKNGIFSEYSYQSVQYTLLIISSATNNHFSSPQFNIAKGYKGTQIKPPQLSA